MCGSFRVLRAVPLSHRLLGLASLSFIHLRNVCVDFPIYQGSSRSLKKALLATSTHGNLGRDALDRINIRALSDVSIDIVNGDRVGLVGLNGAGKTTLLKVLAGVYEPTEGRLIASGNVSSLLDTHVGLNADATGHENIILRGMYMGIHPREMRERAAEVAAFTELGHYLDMPVRTYSAGMMIRLAFAISTCIPPDILIMDEWLTAGDAAVFGKGSAAHRGFRSRLERSGARLAFHGAGGALVQSRAFCCITAGYSAWVRSRKSSPRTGGCSTRQHRRLRRRWRRSAREHRQGTNCSSETAGMAEINLLRRYPRAKRNIEKRTGAQSEENIRIAREYGREYFDGSRDTGYGGYRYDGRWLPIAEDMIEHFGLRPGDRVLDVGCRQGFSRQGSDESLPGA